MTDLTVTVQRPTDGPPRPCPHCGRKSRGIEWTDASGVIHRLYLCPLEHNWMETFPGLDCEHEWVAAALELSETGTGVDECVRCGLLVYVSDTGT